MADSCEIDSAIVARLQNDPALQDLLPDGVYIDLAPQGSHAFTLVSVQAAHDDAAFAAPASRRVLEDVQYLVKAVVRQSSGTTAKHAAARIDALLEDAPLTIPGYTCLQLSRVERLRRTEADDVDPSIVWQHRGGFYRVLAALGETS
jgi:hypothetical protein